MASMSRKEWAVHRGEWIVASEKVAASGGEVKILRIVSVLLTLSVVVWLTKL